jgi:ornithine cyclodeaminase
MRTIRAEQIERLRFPDLIDALRRAFAAGFDVSERWSVPYSDAAGHGNTLLLMPASDGAALGVKLLTLTPGNPGRGDAFIKGCYLLFDTRDGEPRALLDAATLTNVRTAATSALASTLLSRADSRTLLVVGTGSLAPFMARGHAAVRSYERILVWGRDAAKAERVVADLDGLPAEHAPDLDRAAEVADVISCATSAAEPVLRRSHLRAGQHIDLVGSHRPDRQELHEDGVAATRIFVDTFRGTRSEAGDLIVALAHGSIRPEDVLAELSDLAAGRHRGRGSDDEITLFKSVGHAIEDLVAARLLLEGLADG